MKFGIQKKLALAISITLLIFFSISSWLIILYTSRLVRENIQQQQFAMTKIIAESIDDKLGLWLGMISEVSRSVTADTFRNRDRAEFFLEEHSDILSIFNNGIMLLDSELNLIAENPRRSGNAKMHELENFLTNVAKQDFPDISSPYTFSGNNSPAILMAVPVNDANDRFIGFLAGSINLTKDYFIEEITGFKVGKNGYLYLIAVDRTMILHPDKNRIMKKDPLPGRNLLLDKAISGFEGSGETVNSRGMQQLASFKKLRTVEWILGCVFPREEAYAPVYRLRTYLVTASVSTILLFIILTWILTSRITFNLKKLTEQVMEIKDLKRAEININLRSNDEVGVLADSFNNLLSDLGAKECRLIEQRDILEKRTEELEKALQQVKVLGGIIPICAWCKKIRNDAGYWDQLENYISEHSDADFSHGVCPECYEKQINLIERMEEDEARQD